MKKKYNLIYFLALLLAGFDQLIKYIIIRKLELFQSIPVIDNFFNITYLKNEGAAWSILTGNRLFLITISLVIVFLLYFIFIKDNKLNKLEQYVYGILYGGIFGNLIDRIFRGSVIDYLDFKIFNYNFPVFNLADICIVISIILLGIIVFRGDKNEVCNK